MLRIYYPLVAFLVCTVCNAQLVERAVAIIENLNREAASADEARVILGLR